jgi:Cu+-exporting ATPase
MPETFVIRVLNMTSDACAARAQRALDGVAGIEGATVWLSDGRAEFSVTSAKALKDAFAALEKAGFRGALQDDDTAQRAANENDEATLRRAVIFAAVVALPVSVLETGARVFPAFHQAIQSSIGIETSWQLQSILAAIVMMGPGLRFFRRGLPALFRAAPDLNTLVALGTAAAYAHSAFVLAAPELVPEQSRGVYFEYACLIIVVTLFGRWWEARRKAPMAVLDSGTDLVDRICRWYVPAILLLNALMALGWSVGTAQPDIPFILITVLSVLMIACPCAAGLAVPLSISIGSGRAARHGVMFRHAAAFHRLQTVNLMVLDTDLFLEQTSVASQSPMATKADARLAIAALQRLGLRVALTGNHGVAPIEALARELEVDLTAANSAPDGGIAALDRSRKGGDVVAFVSANAGDAAKMAKADISITLGIGRDDADIIIMRRDLTDLLAAVSITAMTRRNTRQNLVFSFGFNIALLPIAAGFLYPMFGILLSPAMATAAAVVSLLYVTANTLRLRRGRDRR